MSNLIWMPRKDGWGDLAVDLRRCVRFFVSGVNDVDGYDAHLCYYLTNDGDWIEETIGPEPDSNTCDLRYCWVPPVQVARETHFMLGRIPPVLSAIS